MKKQKPELPLYDPFHDHYIQSEYHAIYKNGQFIDENTEKPVHLVENAYVRIVVPNVFIPDGDAEQHLKVVTKELFKEPTEFYFDLKMPSVSDYRFFVRSKRKIIAVKKGNKTPTIEYTSCVVYKAIDHHGPIVNFKPLEAISFNEAYTRISEIYRAGKSAHTTSVYRTFYHTNGKSLDDLRKSAF
jgi:hypothetical protein